MKLDISKSIYDYWNSIRGDSAMPLRSELQPGPISFLLPDLFILQWTGDGEMTFRLAGTRVCTLLGAELATRRFSSVWSDRDASSIEDLVRRAEKSAAPVCLDISGLRVDYAPLAFEMVLLPVKDAPDSPSRVLGSLAPHYTSSWQLLEPVVHLKLEGASLIRAGETETRDHHTSRPDREAGFSTLWQRLVGRSSNNQANDLN